MYLLFISYNSGLMHNNMYQTLNDAYQSIKQLILEENLDDIIISKDKLTELLNQDDDYKYCLSNDTWFHIQHKNFS